MFQGLREGINVGRINDPPIERLLLGISFIPLQTVWELPVREASSDRTAAGPTLEATCRRHPTSMKGAGG